VTRQRKGDEGQPDPTVVRPEDPLVLTPPAAAALLRLIRHASAQDAVAGHAAAAQVVPFPARDGDDGPREQGRKAA
jgi:hypothetical protein